MLRSKKAISLFLVVLFLFAGLCGCDSEFDKARAKNHSMKQETKLNITDIEVSNVEIDWASSSGHYLDVVGIVKNNSSKKASSITLTLYLYESGSVVLTEKDYIFDLGPYDENSFKIMVDQTKWFSCDDYVVKITDVF